MKHEGKSFFNHFTKWNGVKSTFWSYQSTIHVDTACPSIRKKRTCGSEWHLLIERQRRTNTISFPSVRGFYSKPEISRRSIDFPRAIQRHLLSADSAWSWWHSMIVHVPLRVQCVYYTTYNSAVFCQTHQTSVFFFSRVDHPLSPPIVMGKGGHNPQVVSNNAESLDSTALVNAPHRLPTLSEIKVKIPSHCFRPTVRQSLSYVFKDIVYVALTFLVMYQIRASFQYGFLLFPLYWYVQGQCKFHLHDSLLCSALSRHTVHLLVRPGTWLWAWKLQFLSLTERYCRSVSSNSPWSSPLKLLSLYRNDLAYVDLGPVLHLEGRVVRRLSLVDGHCSCCCRLPTITITRTRVISIRMKCFILSEVHQANRCWWMTSSTGCPVSAGSTIWSRDTL